MRNTADVTGKPIAVFLESISRVSAINPLVAYYDIHGGKREVLLLEVRHVEKVMVGMKSLQPVQSPQEAAQCLDVLQDFPSFFLL
jgi:hypothetical protein